MNEFFSNITIPSLWIITTIELLLFVYLVYKYIKTKSFFIILTTILTFGLLYDALIISIGSLTDANNMIFFSRIRFVLHGGLVPLLFLMSEQALNLNNKKLKLAFYITTGVLIVLGVVSSFVATYKVIVMGGVSRLVVDSDKTATIIEVIPVIINIISIIPIIVAGIIVIKKERNVFLLLSGIFMLTFSMLPQMINAKDYMFLISMFGEVLLVLFSILYFIKKEKKTE